MLLQAAILGNMAQHPLLSTAATTTSAAATVSSDFALLHQQQQSNLLQRLAALSTTIGDLQQQQQAPAANLASFFGPSQQATTAVAATPSSITTSPVSPLQTLAVPPPPPLPFISLQHHQLNGLTTTSAHVPPPIPNANPLLMQALLGSLLHQQQLQQQQELQPPFISSTSEDNSNNPLFQLVPQPQQHQLRGHRQGSAFQPPPCTQNHQFAEKSIRLGNGMKRAANNSPFDTFEQEQHARSKTDENSSVSAKRVRSERDISLDYSKGTTTAEAITTTWRGRKQHFAAIIERQKQVPVAAAGVSACAIGRSVSSQEIIPASLCN